MTRLLEECLKESQLQYENLPTKRIYLCSAENYLLGCVCLSVYFSVLTVTLKVMNRT